MITRREFLKWLGVVAVGVGLGAVPEMPEEEAQEDNWADFSHEPIGALTTGIGRGSPLTTDNLNFILRYEDQEFGVVLCGRCNRAILESEAEVCW